MYQNISSRKHKKAAPTHTHSTSCIEYCCKTHLNLYADVCWMCAHIHGPQPHTPSHGHPMWVVNIVSACCILHSRNTDDGVCLCVSLSVRPSFFCTLNSHSRKCLTNSRPYLLKSNSNSSWVIRQQLKSLIQFFCCSCFVEIAVLFPINQPI